MPCASRTITRALLIGDVHCEDVSVERVLAWGSSRGIEDVLCVGDIVDGPGDVERTVALLRDHAVTCVSGNHERWLLAGQARELPEATLIVSDETRSFLESLPTSRRFDTPRGGLLLCHGVGESDMEQLAPDTFGYALAAMPELTRLLDDPRVRIMVGGHTHRRMVRDFGDLVVINPGTLLRRHEPCFAVADFAASRVEFWALDRGKPHLVESLGLP